MWSLDQLKSELSRRPEVKGWILSIEHVHRKERYFLSEGSARCATDQDRDTHSEAISGRVIVKQSKPDRQGELSKKFFRTLPLAAQIDSAIQGALQTDLQAWDLPKEIAKPTVQVKTTDPRIAEDLNAVMEQLTKEVKASAEKKRPVQFNSSEVFLSTHDFELYLSNGLSHRSSQSRVYVEAAFSTEKLINGKKESDEYLGYRWAVSLNDLPVAELFDDVAFRAGNTLGTQKPQARKYQVLVDSDVLSHVIHQGVSQLSGVNSYHGLPFIKTDSQFIPSVRGDTLTITLNPHLDFGADTGAISSQGTLQKPLDLIRDNTVMASMTDQQYASYLGISATTVRGDLVVQPGNFSYEDLIRSSPQVLEILQFSALFGDPNTGTFSSEIRLARLFDHEKGTVEYIKGGSLSGSIFENFQNLKLSKEVVRHANFTDFSPAAQGGVGYFGPKFALLNDVSVVS